MAMTQILLLLFGILTASLFALIYGGYLWFVSFRAKTVEITQARLSELFIQMDSRFLFLICASLGTIIFLVCLTGKHVITAVGALCLGLAAPRILTTWLMHRRKRAIDGFLPDALLTLADCIRAGAGIQAAIQHLCDECPDEPLAREFSVLLAEQRLGLSLEQALLTMAKRVDTVDFQQVVTVMRIAQDTGGNLAEMLERISGTLRQKAAMEGKIRSLTAQGKLQGWVVGLLPVVMIVVLFQLEPGPMSYLLHSRAGWLTLVVVVTLEIMGAWAIRRIVTIDV